MCHNKTIPCQFFQTTKPMLCNKANSNSIQIPYCAQYCTRRHRLTSPKNLEEKWQLSLLQKETLVYIVNAATYLTTFWNKEKKTNMTIYITPHFEAQHSKKNQAWTILRPIQLCIHERIEIRSLLKVGVAAVAPSKSLFPFPPIQARTGKHR